MFLTVLINIVGLEGEIEINLGKIYYYKNNKHLFSKKVYFRINRRDNTFETS